SRRSGMRGGYSARDALDSGAYFRACFQRRLAGVEEPVVEDDAAREPLLAEELTGQGAEHPAGQQIEEARRPGAWAEALADALRVRRQLRRVVAAGGGGDDRCGEQPRLDRRADPFAALR